MKEVRSVEVKSELAVGVTVSVLSVVVVVTPVYESG